ncbi:hypothetical protein C1752_01144 [Acaryochloris thomasi RCC1774]|uniref:YbjN domain-containing protein n=1 Tax=Acaryochloris thomasi RCC1774 TaxID=1764569 RepID=A0A2W1K2R8_9CYAN|nr:hypothetical protein [Acaryochloris thomasi]PZD74327.1 hypothetical protein C1752_01144 [Acaryochloris thomasi RCC1774]
MGATLQQIAGYLESRGLDYQVQSDKFRILTYIAGENKDNLLTVVQLDEEGGFFKLFMPEVITGVQDHPHKAQILQTMLVISWETKMLQWEYDPMYGEIRAIIEFPLEDATLTERQFDRCFNGLVEMVDVWAIPRLQEVLATGTDPGDMALGERLLLTMEEEAPGLLALLERAMAARKERGQFPPRRELPAED